MLVTKNVSFISKMFVLVFILLTNYQTAYSENRRCGDAITEYLIFHESFLGGDTFQDGNRPIRDVSYEVRKDGRVMASGIAKEGRVRFRLAAGVYSVKLQKNGYLMTSLRRHGQQLFIAEAESCEGKHSADMSVPYFQLSISELLRAIQLYNYQEYHCDGSTEDGYAPGPGSRNCAPHSSDYLNGSDWKISTTEISRLIQLYNFDMGFYRIDLTTEDGFAPGR